MTQASGRGFGTASGENAPDGSPVEFYRLLPAFDEPEIIHDALPPGSDILELGCGAGRITHPLIELGHMVVGVDESPEMLAHVRGAETVLSRIEGLDLGRTFRGVVLASHLVNTPDGAQRKAFLDACARHVAPEGSVLIQRADPARDSAPGPVSETVVHGVLIRHRVLSRRGTLISAVAEYRIGDGHWTHAYRADLLDDAALTDVLYERGLVRSAWLDERRSWVLAVPTPMVPDPEEWTGTSAGTSRPDRVKIVPFSRATHEEP
jgi:SAM-dependent methyltransferase